MDRIVMSRRALVAAVDDNPEMLATIRMVLQSDRYDVVTFTNPREALRALLADGPPLAVLLSDLDMPEMTGIELLVEARKRSPQTVRMLITGNGANAAVAGVNEGEIFRFVSKPFNALELRKMVDDALDRHEAEAEDQGARLSRARRQQFVREIELEHPGITRVPRTADGAYLHDGALARREASALGLGDLLARPRKLR